MSLLPLYEDALTYRVYGKSKLPISVKEKRSSHHYPLHYHNFAELSLIVEGSGTEILNGKPHPFRRGTVSFLLPNHMHEIHVDAPSVHKFHCMFDISLLFLNPADSELASCLLKTGEEWPSHYDLNEEQTVYMTELFKTMRQEYENEHFAKDTALHAKLLEAFVFLARLHRRAESELEPRNRDSSDNVTKVVQYLHLHYRDEITLTGVARLFDWNPSYMSRVFKQHVGQTFTAYLHSLRVGRAESLLAATPMSVVDIAVEAGFDHPRTMTRAFKELRGMTPTEYRNRYCRKN